MCSRRWGIESKTAAAPWSRSSCSDQPPVTTQIVSRPALAAASTSQRESPTITAEIYSGVRDRYAMEAMNKLQFGAAPASGFRHRSGKAGVPDYDPTSMVTEPGDIEGELERALQESNLRPLAPEANALSS